MYMFRLLFDIEADENFSLDFDDPSQEASLCDLEEQEQKCVVAKITATNQRGL